MSDATARGPVYGAHSEFGKFRKVLVEVKAARRGSALHNHAAHCLFVRDGLVAEWWMVEALPAESEAFWSS